MNKNFLTAISIILWSIGLYLWSIHTVTFTKVESDFAQDYAAAGAFLEGRSIYGDSIVNWVQKNIGQEGINNYHPPLAVFLYIPFTFLDYPSACFAWSVFILISYLVTLKLLAQEFKLDFPLLSGFGLCWYPWVSTVGSLQVSSVMGLAFVLSWIALKKKQNFQAGALVSFAAFFKLFPLFFALYFIINKNWRALAGLSSIFAFGVLIILLTQGFTPFIYYKSHIIPEQLETWLTFPFNISLSSFLAGLFIKNHWIQPVYESKLIYQIINLSLSVFLFFLSYRKLRSLNEQGSCLALILMSLFAPIMWTHGFVGIIFVFVYLFKLAMESKSLAIKIQVFTILLLSAMPDVYINRFLVDLYKGVGFSFSAYLCVKSGFVVLLLMLVFFLNDKVSFNHGIHGGHGDALRVLRG